MVEPDPLRGGASAVLPMSAAFAGASESAAGAILALSAQGVMAGGSRFPDRAAVSPGDLAAVLVRFEAHTATRAPWPEGFATPAG